MKSFFLVLSILVSPLFANAQTLQDPQILEQAIAEGRAIEVGPQENYLRTENQRTVKISAQNYQINDSNGNPQGISRIECKGYCEAQGWLGSDFGCALAGSASGCQQQRAYCGDPYCSQVGCVPQCFRSFTSAN